MTETKPSLLASLTRMLCLEKGFSLWTEVANDGALVADRGALKAMEGFDVSLVSIPELRELRKKGRRLFVRQDGMNFQVVLVRRVKSPTFTPPLSIEEVVDLGATFLDRTGSMSGTKIPVSMEILEIHAGSLDGSYDEAIASYKRRGLSKPKVAVGVKAVEEKTGKVKTNYPIVGHLIQGAALRRAWRNRDDGPEAYREAVRNSGFKPLHALVGSVAGGALCLALFFLLLWLGAEDGTLFGGAMVISGLVGGAVSILMSRVRSQSLAQCLVGGLGAFGLSLVGSSWLGMEHGFASVVIGIVIAGICGFLGSQANTIATKL